jgi:cytoplasmic iron level regulating protein YaaA (DUF328/UPF0246 family)
MKISDKLASLTYQAYQAFDEDNNIASPAIDSFKGDVYEALKIDDFTNKDISYTQDHLRIISGLYGILKPLDLIYAYRLEMGTILPINHGGIFFNNLYQFWQQHITYALSQLLLQNANSNLVNLASGEYFKVINKTALNSKIITPIFKENIKNTNQYKIIPIHSKKGRGVMARYILKNRIDNINDIKDFSEFGYRFSKKDSDDHNLVFIR